MAQARRDMLPVRSEGLQVERAESASLCNLLIIPVGGVPKPDSFYFWCFLRPDHGPPTLCKSLYPRRNPRPRTPPLLRA